MKAKGLDLNRSSISTCVPVPVIFLSFFWLLSRTVMSDINISPSFQGQTNRFGMEEFSFSPACGLLLIS